MLNRPIISWLNLTFAPIKIHSYTYNCSNKALSTYPNINVFLRHVLFNEEKNVVVHYSCCNCLHCSHAE